MSEQTLLGLHSCEQTLLGAHTVLHDDDGSPAVARPAQEQSLLGGRAHGNPNCGRPGSGDDGAPAARPAGTMQHILQGVHGNMLVSSAIISESCVAPQW